MWYSQGLKCKAERSLSVVGKVGEKHTQKKESKNVFFFSSFETHYQSFAFGILYLSNIRKLFHWFDLHISVMLFV
jgi:hypothetical protein